MRVTIQNNGREPITYGAMDFKTQDSQGRVYNPSDYIPDPKISIGNLSTGETVQGNLTFLVPLESRGLVLVYQPVSLFNPPVIRIYLGDPR